MRYLKLIDGRLAEYSGPQMGAAYYAAEGYLPYAGKLGADWLHVDGEAIAELSPEEYAALHPEPPKRYSQLRVIEELGAQWPQIESMMTELERAKFFAADYLEAGRPDVESFLIRLRSEIGDLDVILARCEI